MLNIKKIGSFLLALFIYFLLFLYVLHSTGEKLDFSAYVDYGIIIWNGWLRTIIVSILSVLLSLIVGLVLYFLQESGIGVFFYIAQIHKTIIFGTPLVVIAIVSYYYVGNAFGISNKVFIGIVTLGLYIGAYIADIYKGAIESIHLNQWQTAKMFGFTRYQTYRYIIFPQVLKSILPPLAGQFALTIKGSALLSFMGLSEFLNEVNIVQANSFEIMEGFIILAIGYWLITVPIIIVVRRFEERLHVRVVK